MTKYRPDIDGLRGISVVGVMLFHAGSGLRGGFVGVDVFFVISGYLIGGLIATQLDSRTFSLADFWERRIRRIWPAALAVTAASLAAGWFMFLPEDYRALAGDAISQIAMVANVRYLDSSDYFAPASDLRPLLHTWSLAVEEQFYVFFPLIMMGLWRLPRRYRALLLCLMTAGSFAASAVALRSAPSAVFYLLPYRAWEMLLGALLAVAPFPAIGWKALRELLGFCGLLCILVSMVFYDRTTPFPGVAALPACAGAVFVIYAGTDASTLTSRLLASAPLRMVGLLSYSLYLWHWPVLAFVRYAKGIELSFLAVTAAYALTGCLAFLSWRLIETPFRRRGANGRLLRVAGAAVAASGCLLLAALLIRSNDGCAGRFDPSVSTFARQPSMPDISDTGLRVRSTSLALETIGRACSPDARPCLFLWGDSHGLAIRPTLERLVNRLGFGGYSLLQHAAAPVPGVWRPGDPRGEQARLRAMADGEEILRWIATHRPKHVALCGRWSRYLEGGLADNGQEFRIAAVDDEPSADLDRERAVAAFQRGLRIIARQCAAVEAQLWIILEVPYQPLTPRQRAIDAALAGTAVSSEGVTLDEHRAYQNTVTKALADLHDIDFHAIDLAAPFFEEDGISRVGRNGRCWYRDDDHINDHGASEALSQILTAFVNAIAESCERCAP